jgi:hypothetical protein
MVGRNTEYISANEFGLKRIVLDPERKLRTLFHDDARHGIQSTVAGRSHEPLAYYHPSGPLGDVFAAFTPPDIEAQVAIIGLGVGAMAAYAEPGQHFIFFEIDPAIARVAPDTRYFTFLAQCRGKYDIVVGDGLDMLAHVGDHCLHMIILDAFSSDKIPAHLTSSEALEVYLKKLADGGMLGFHISNVHVELAPLLGKLADEAGLTCLSRADFELSDEDRAGGKLPSQYVVMARSLKDIPKLADNPLWKAPDVG